MSGKEKTLLPQGFHDQLPPLAEKEIEINSLILKSIFAFGYDLVRPALLEFENTINNKNSDLFMVTDTISGRMMAIRADITPQISRIVHDRYGSKLNEGSIRIAYSGQVVKKLPKGKNLERQLTQTGYELVSESSANRDAETLFIAIETLKNINLQDYTIDLSFPKFIHKILLANKIPESEWSNLISIIEDKDFSRISEEYNFIKEYADILDDASCLDTAKKSLAKIKANLSGDALKIIDRIFEVIEILDNSNVKANIGLNLLEVNNFDKYSGLCYSIISNKTLDEIARGGRYNIDSSSDQNSASGLTFFVDSLMNSLEFSLDKKIENRKYSQGFQSSEEDRKNGITTIFE